MTGAKLVVEMNIKKIAHQQEMNVGVDFLEGIEEYVNNIVYAAMDRANKNGRTTIMERDIGI